jgi:enoyl-CoA hydratase
MTFSSSVISLEVDDHVATLWLNRPDARNALGSEFWRELPHAAEVLAADSRVRAVVISAKGPHFSVGLDLKEFATSFTAGPSGHSAATSNRRSYQAIRAMQESISTIARLEVPVIAAVHGYCIGGGVDLICACDIRLASRNATFSVREAKVAIVADLGTLERLPRLIGAGHVAELAFTGKDIDAERAATIGLVNSLHGENADDVYLAALEMAREIAQNSPLAVRGTKAVLLANDGRTIDEGLDFVAKWNTMYLHSNDLREAMSAFMERRSPQFDGT